MRSLARRSLVLLAVLALVLGAFGAAAPAALARHGGFDPTNTTVRGIDVDATTNPQLHAVIKVAPTATAQARLADKARRFGVRLPLLGIPVIVKDNIDTRDMPTTAGSFALKNSRTRDAFIEI